MVIIVICKLQLWFCFRLISDPICFAVLYSFEYNLLKKDSVPWC
jgi:hypothetical protein